MNLTASSRETASQHLSVAAFLVICFVCYQFILCFINTNIAPISNPVVAATEGVLLLWATLRIFPTCRFNEIALAISLLVYFMLLCALRGGLDPEGPRNVFIILISYALGRATPNREAANRLVWMVSFIVLFFAVAEYFFADSYLRVINIMQYYTARGLMSADVMQWLPQDSFTSAFRASGRNIMPFLGNQRVSSVFLEPVSMGNYAIIVGIWGLSFEAAQKRQAIRHLIIAAILIIACDSRFASLLIFALLLARFSPILQRREFIVIMPVFAVVGLLLFTHFGLGNADDDNISGRLMRSGLATMSLSFAQLLGIGEIEGLGDMGVAYSFEHFGLLLCGFLWLLFALSQKSDIRTRRYRLMLALYAISILLISGTSFYSSKTGALAWFLYGVLANKRGMVS